MSKNVEIAKDLHSEKSTTDSATSMTRSKMGRKLQIVRFLVRICVAVAAKFWKLCSSALLILFLVYWFTGALIALGFFIVAVIGIFFNAQDMLLYYPEQPPNSRLYVMLPNAYQMPYENHFVNTSDGVKINLVLVKHPKPNVPTIIYFHGNAGNVGHRLMNTHALFEQCKYNILLVEYRGYGKSEGSPSEGGLYKDAEAAMDFLLKRTDIDRNKLIVFGRSLGGAVAVHLASQSLYERHIAVLVIENTFSSLPDIARTLFDFPFLKYLPDILVKAKYRSISRLPTIKVPTLFLSGLADSLIPPRMMDTLHTVSGSKKKRIVRFPGGTHNETWMSQGYYQAIINFVNEILRTRSFETDTETMVNMTTV
ncbi:protein ABHD13-like [Mytilus trossulus]